MKSLEEIIKALKNGTTHIGRFFERTQLGGIIGYRKANFTELKNLQSAYKEFLHEDKNDNKDSDAKSIADKALDNMLEIDWDKKKPKATEQQIADCFVFKNPPERGDLTADCESIFNFVKNKVDQRLEAAKGTYEQLNSAIVLFSAELLTWLKQLATRPCETSTYKDVCRRIRYLEAILEKTVFPDETKNNFSIHLVVFNVVNLLEKKILPRILWKVEESSAREHFDRLIKHAEAYIRYAVNALFVLYSDSENANEFDFAIYRDVKNTTLQSMMNTRLGDTLQYLSKLHIALLPEVKDSNIEYPRLTDNSFLEKGRVLNSNLLKTLDITSNEPRLLGIHSVMQQKDFISAFILQLGYLNDFGVLLLGFRKAYRLCGQGGNYLMYVELCQETYSLLAAYTHLIQQSQQGFMFIQNTSWELYEKHTVEYTELTWRKHFLGFRAKLRNMEVELRSCRECLMKLLNGMEDASKIDYKKALMKEIQEFRGLINAVEERLGGQFNDNNASLTSSASLSTQAPSLTVAPYLQLEDTITDETLRALLARTNKTLERARKQNVIEENKESKQESFDH